jgi:hypothetical protein
MGFVPGDISRKSTQIFRQRTECADGARCRVRICTTDAEDQALRSSDSQIDSQKIRADAVLIELMRTWPKLGATVQRALLDIAHSYLKDIHGEGRERL